MKPLLSVCLITYNHVNYIEQAIESVLMQQVNFPWELIIADDFSIDGTRQIVLSYQKKYPEIIKLILQEKNTGAAQNFMDLITYPASKYIAYFEGDDYWTDPNKLQKQVDFLQANDDYAICFHSVKIENSIKNITQYSDRNLKTESTIFDYATKNYIPTPSVLFRNCDLTNYHQWAQKCLIGDYVLFLYIAQFGKIHFIQEDMAVYRVHASSAWNGIDYNVSLLNYVKSLDILIENIPIIKKELIFQQYEVLKKIPKADSNYLSHIPRSLLHLIDQFEQLKLENIELNRKYNLLNNSRMVRLIKSVKRFLHK